MSVSALLRRLDRARALGFGGRHRCHVVLIEPGEAVPPIDPTTARRCPCGGIHRVVIEIEEIEVAA